MLVFKFCPVRSHFPQRSLVEVAHVLWHIVSLRSEGATVKALAEIITSICNVASADFTVLQGDNLVSDHPRMHQMRLLIVVFCKASSRSERREAVRVLGTPSTSNQVSTGAALCLKVYGLA